LQTLPPYVIWLLVPLCYYAGAKLGVAVAAMPEGISILWPASSVLLAAMLLSRPRHLPLIAVLGVAAELAADVPHFTATEALVFGVANALEATTACVLLKAWRFDTRFRTLTDVQKFLVAGPLVATLLAAACGAAVYTLVRGDQTPYLQMVRVWWLGDAMGLLIFTPLVLSLASGRDAPVPAGANRRGRLIDAAVALLGIGVLAVLLFWRGGDETGLHVAPVLSLPIVLYVAARFDLRVVTSVVAAVGLAVAYATTSGGHPFGMLPAQEATLRAQEFILAMSLLALGLYALLAQLRERQRELGAANERLEQLKRTLEARVAERTAALDASRCELERLAMTDVLTGIANRRAFFAASRTLIDNARRHARPVTAVMVDIDHFKRVNDSHGHAVGDKVLQHVAATLAPLVRSGDVFARYGGEEFVLLAPETDVDSALALACRMGDALRERACVVDGLSIGVTASFGVAVMVGADVHDDLEQLLQRADEALYAAKHAGRDCARVIMREGAAAHEALR